MMMVLLLDDGMSNQRIALVCVVFDDDSIEMMCVAVVDSTEMICVVVEMMWVCIVVDDSIEMVCVVDKDV